jgi:hypothetical protein
MAEHRDIGQAVSERVTFRDLSGALADPTAVTLRIRTPAGVVTSYTGAQILRESVGVYSKALAYDMAGYWGIRWEATGAVMAAEEKTVIVGPSEFYSAALLSPRALVSLQEAKAELKEVGQQLEDLDFVQRINAVSTTIHNVSGREFVARNATRDADGTRVVAAQTRTFDVGHPPMRRERYYVDGELVGGPWGEIRVGDLASLTSVNVRDRAGTLVEAVALGDIVTLPRNRQEWEPITRLWFMDTVSLNWNLVIEVTGVWGFPQIPEDVKRAAYEEVAVNLDRDTTNYRESLAVEQAGAGSQVILTGGAGGRDYRELTSPRAQAIAMSYREAVFA